MTDAEYEALKGRVRALADRWLGPLGLKWWRVDIVYERRGLERSDDMKAADQYTLMRCAVLWQYLTATITVNCPECLDLSDARLEETFVHELAHIFINEMRVTDRAEVGWLDHEERVATMLGKAFLWLREHVEQEWRERLEAASTGGDG